MVTLKFSLSPQAVSKLHDMLACLAKFSDTVSLEARKDYVHWLMPLSLISADAMLQLSISSLNLSKSAYAAFTLKRKFFEAFKYVSVEDGGEGKFTCSILNKVCQSRSLSLRA